MGDARENTRDLLQRWRQGERAALDALLSRDLAWVANRVRRRLGPALRERVETMDLVQEAMVDALRYGPKVTMDDAQAFRALMARIIENNIRDENRRMGAAARGAKREHRRASDTILELEGAARAVTSPTAHLNRAEELELLHLGVELLSTEDREIVRLRQFDGRSFREIGESLGVEENTARMRFQRALGRLSSAVMQIRKRGVQALSDEVSKS